MTKNIYNMPKRFCAGGGACPGPGEGVTDGFISPKRMMCNTGEKAPEAVQAPAEAAHPIPVQIAQAKKEQLDRQKDLNNKINEKLTEKPPKPEITEAAKTAKQKMTDLEKEQRKNTNLEPDAIKGKLDEIQNILEAPEKKEQAKAAYKEGREMMKQNKYEEAIKKFEEADGKLPGFKPRYYKAECLEKLGRTAEAISVYEALAAEFKNPGSYEGKSFAGLAAGVPKRLEELKTKLAEETAKKGAEKNRAETPAQSPRLKELIDKKVDPKLVELFKDAESKNLTEYYNALHKIALNGDDPAGANFQLRFNKGDLNFSFVKEGGIYKVYWLKGGKSGPLYDFKTRAGAMKSLINGYFMQELNFTSGLIVVKYDKDKNLDESALANAYKKHEDRIGEVDDLEYKKPITEHSVTFSLDWKGGDAQVEAKVLPHGNIRYKLTREHAGTPLKPDVREGTVANFDDFMKQLEQIRQWAENYEDLAEDADKDPKKLAEFTNRQMTEIYRDQICNPMQFFNATQKIGRPINFATGNENNAEMYLDWGDGSKTGPKSGNPHVEMKATSKGIEYTVTLKGKKIKEGKGIGATQILIGELEKLKNPSAGAAEAAKKPAAPAEAEKPAEKMGPGEAPAVEPGGKPVEAGAGAPAGAPGAASEKAAESAGDKSELLNKVEEAQKEAEKFSKQSIEARDKASAKIGELKTAKTDAEREKIRNEAKKLAAEAERLAEEAKERATRAKEAAEKLDTRHKEAKDNLAKAENALKAAKKKPSDKSAVEKAGKDLKDAKSRFAGLDRDLPIAKAALKSTENARKNADLMAKNARDIAEEKTDKVVPAQAAPAAAKGAPAAAPAAEGAQPEAAPAGGKETPAVPTAAPGEASEKSMTSQEVKDAAKAKFAEGNTAFNNGKYENALALYREADRYFPGAPPKHQIAKCLDKMGPAYSDEAVTAYNDFMRFYNEMDGAGKEKYKKRFEEATARVAVLEADASRNKELLAAAKAARFEEKEAPSGTEKTEPTPEQNEAANRIRKTMVRETRVIAKRISDDVNANKGDYFSSSTNDFVMGNIKTTVLKHLNSKVSPQDLSELGDRHVAIIETYTLQKGSKKATIRMTAGKGKITVIVDNRA